MFRAGDVIENPVTGERITFIQTAAETDGEFVIVETVVQPGGAVATKHIHPHQEERFEVLAGSVGFEVGRENVTAGPGEHLVVPAGTPHKFWNDGTVEATFVAEVRPALHFEELLGTMFALAADGKTNTHGLPNPLRLAVIAQAYADTIRVPFPPAFVQRAGLAVAAPVGRMLGFGVGENTQQGRHEMPQHVAAA
jgi:mannose-6-phosphate isomerase-like protein (cupin superfamily)